MSRDVVSGRRAVVFSVLIALLGWGCGGAMRERPNIVLLVIDTLRADHLVSYGYGCETSPFLAQLAREGSQFQRTYSASSWTSPATASLLTSTYPFQHGVVLNLHSINLMRQQNVKIDVNRIPSEAETLAEMLKRAGYRTFGLSDNINVSDVMGFDAGFDRFQTEKYLGAHQLSDMAREWGDDLRDGEEPFFLYLHYMDPHQPYKRHRKQPWFDQFVEERDDISPGDLDHPGVVVKGQPNVAFEIAYDTEIRYVDEEVDKLFHDLDLLENTFVIVVGDHGEEFWDHGKLGHSHSLYNELLLVPFFLYGPDTGVPRGETIGGDAALIDVLPTIAGRIGIEPDKAVQGKNLWPLIRKGGRVEDRTLFAHLVRRAEEIPGDEGFTLFSVITPESKLIRSSLGPVELFDRADDPLESTNLAGADATTADSLIDLIDRVEEEGPIFAPESTSVALDSADIEHLRALGYVR